MKGIKLSFNTKWWVELVSLSVIVGLICAVIMWVVIGDFPMPVRILGSVGTGLIMMVVNMFRSAVIRMNEWREASLLALKQLLPDGAENSRAPDCVISVTIEDGIRLLQNRQETLEQTVSVLSETCNDQARQISATCGYMDRALTTLDCDYDRSYSDPRPLAQALESKVTEFRQRFVAVAGERDVQNVRASKLETALLGMFIDAMNVGSRIWRSKEQKDGFSLSAVEARNWRREIEGRAAKHMLLIPGLDAKMLSRCMLGESARIKDFMATTLILQFLQKDGQIWKDLAAMLGGYEVAQDCARREDEAREANPPADRSEDSENGP